MFPELPLSASGLAIKEEILAIPVTFEPIVDDLPEELANGRMGALYDAVNEGDLRVAPELKKLIARHPGYPTLQNYLRCLYQIADKPRQAEQVLKELERCHPQYLFTRLGLAGRALERGKLDQVREALGQELDLRELYPERAVFHIAEIRNYYLQAGIYHARVGDVETAHGVRAALEQLEPDSDVTMPLMREIILAGRQRMEERFRRDEAKRVEVKIPSLPHRPSGAKAPRFEHSEIDLLYRHDTEIPLARLREILALPRESLVRDLIRVLEDALLRTPDFMAGDVPEEQEFCAPFHALHLLAELRATEALEAVLRFFELHPDALDFWLADGEFAAPLSQLVGDDLPRCVDWLKSPGIHADGKFHIANGMNRLALVEPERKAEIVGCLEEVFRFILASPPAANVLDTHFLSFLAGDLLDLRVVSALPALTEAWEKDFLEESMIGDLAAITEQMAAPESPAPKPFSLTEVYGQSGSPYGWSGSEARFDDLTGGWEDEDESVQESGFDSVPIGRNDPCPCGSGKKYKKCCMD